MYYFRYRARNVHGWSAGYSPVQAILMATVPEAAAPVRTSNSGLNVVLEWDAPTFDGASAIVQYRVQIRGKDSLFRVESTACDGADAHKAAMLSGRTCTIPMTALTAAETFALVEGDLIVATVESLNAIGYSPPSVANTAGASVQVVPAAPPTAPTRGPSTNTA